MRLDISIKDLSDSQHAFFEKLVTEHGTKAAAVKFMLDELMLMNGTGKNTMRISTHDKIHELVLAQMTLNATTDKVIRVGTGENAIDVKYEQRTITSKWIQEKAGATQQACLEYLEIHKVEVENHHQAVLGLTDNEKIKNFNRRTGKATAKVK